MATEQPGLLGDMSFIQQLAQSGYTPEQMKQMLEDRKAERLAALSAEQLNRQMLAKGVGQLGRGVAGLFGASVPEDPMIRQATQLRELQKQFDTNTSDGMMKMAAALRQINPTLAQEAAKKAQEMALKEAQTHEERMKGRKTAAEAARAESAARREDDLTKALAELPDEASDEDIRKALLKYGSADKLLTVMTASADRKAQREAQLERTRMEIEGRIEQARIAGANRAQIAQMQIEGRQALAQMAAALKQTKAETADDKAATRIGQNIVFDKLHSDGEKLIKQIDDNKNAFTLTGRGVAAFRSVSNPDSPDVKARSDVDAYLNKARNAYLLAAKGIQTEGDATRAWKEFAGTLDFSSAEGAKRSVERIRQELLTQKQANEAYLRSRGLSAPAATPAAAPTNKPSVSNW